MTSSQIPSRIAMPCPFGGFGSDNITPIKTVTGTDINFPDGFPSAYGAPTDTSGKFVTRKEMNAIGNLASNDLFYHKCGGLNTFDADFCASIGGYPKGAVLEYLMGNQLYYVMSLKDNNKIDFTGKTPTSSQSDAGITSGGVDSINWVFCNTEMPSQQIISLYSSDDTNITIGDHNNGYIAGVVRCFADGIITGQISLKYGYNGTADYSVSYTSDEGKNYYLYGGGLFIKDITSYQGEITITGSNIDTWTCLAVASQDGSLKGRVAGSTGAALYYDFNLINCRGANKTSEKVPVYGTCAGVSGHKYAIAVVSSNWIGHAIASNVQPYPFCPYYILPSLLSDTIRYGGFSVKLSVV